MGCYLVLNLFQFGTWYSVGSVELVKKELGDVGIRKITIFHGLFTVTKKGT